MSIMNGDDLLTVQRNLVHSQASTTLNVYGHVTTQMQEESAARMDALIQQVEKKA